MPSIKANPIIADIRRELRTASDADTKASGQTFFKEKIKTYGVKTPAVGKIAKAHFGRVKDIGKDEILALCEELWGSGYMEEAFIACHWSDRIASRFEPQDFAVLARWVDQYVTNWATCDTLCNHTVAAFMEMYPDHLAELKTWARSKNRWTRRAAAVTLIIPARHGRFLDEVFDIADILLRDDDDLVRKGYGWMLKAASESNRKAIFDYVMKNKSEMPRTALRYAIEKMPKTLKAKAMRK
ncbi:DNA alkylation repair protein [Xanthobacteraceae bacterium Astr-EGSB]|uniref:DNA alkylation repair protein n=1 Tax=Astrobacterium formosum TaxID=3069710 RepID=UPI0027AEAC25|nr:DNA alkylation repair protein [Xanthobacteraceae bacterium Astr-EGSB]